MSVSEAEEVVEQLGEAGMLSLEQGVIDPTTEEGKARLEELEREGREGKQIEEVGEPGMIVEDQTEKESLMRGLKAAGELGGGHGEEIEVADVD